MACTQLITVDDAAAIAELMAADVAFQAPWQPAVPPERLTADAQRASIELILGRHAEGLALPLVILDERRAIVGRVTLNDVVPGVFQSCHLGYWVASWANGRGLATAAVAEALGRGFGELGLHRVQAATLLHNAASQRVLRKNGFEAIGVARRYLQIAGEWQDHLLHQALAPDG